MDFFTRIVWLDITSVRNSPLGRLLAGEEDDDREGELGLTPRY
jgi:hypothetical protein